MYGYEQLCFMQEEIRKVMDIIKAEFVVTTPMFLGAASAGANKQPECADGIRGASVKGALRATYRALNWSRIRKSATDDTQALHQLHAEEAAIFGSAVKDKKGGQAQFLLRVQNMEAAQQKQQAITDSALHYLLGMGLYEAKNKSIARDHIPAETTFKLELALKPSLSKAQKQQLQETLLFWGLTGGLGSRARKGFGSVSITSLEWLGKKIDLPTTVQEYKAKLQSLVGKDLVDGLAPLTAFSNQTKMQLSGSNNDALVLLKHHGTQMGVYRGFGFNGKTLGQKAEANFDNDRQWVYKLSKENANVNYLPQRSVFGLPHPAYYKNIDFNVKIDAETGRRASPLFAHIHQFPNGLYILLHTLYVSQFLPEQTKVLIDSEFGKDRRAVKAQGYTLNNLDNRVDWSVLDTFLQRFNPTTEDVIYG